VFRLVSEWNDNFDSQRGFPLSLKGGFHFLNTTRQKNRETFRILTVKQPQHVVSKRFMNAKKVFSWLQIDM
jgi:hypothetical protein